MIKNILLFGILILSLNSCGESTKKDSEYIYKNGESSVELKILNGNNFLRYDTPIRADFEWINTDPNTGLIYGAGIKILENKIENTKKTITRTEITVPSDYLETDTLNIKLRFEIKGEKISTEFNVPLKDKI